MHIGNRIIRMKKRHINIMIISSLFLMLFIYANVSADILGMKLLTPQIGWVLTEKELYWTTDFGTTWKNVTPKAIKDGHIAYVFFLNPTQGWILYSGVGGRKREFNIAYTDDCGTTWSIRPVKLPAGYYKIDEVTPERGLDGDGLIKFVDPIHGWMNLRCFASPAMGDYGILFRTEDGGKTWQELRSDSILEWPTGFDFITAKDGWWSQYGGGSLYVTHNGGDTWQEVTIKPPPELSENGCWHETPIFKDEKNGFLPVIYVSGIIMLYATHDGGKTWKEDRVLRDMPEAYEYGKSPLTVVDSTLITATVSKAENFLTLIKVAPDGTVLHYISNTIDRGGINNTLLDFITNMQGWALTHNNVLLSTIDGGVTWNMITPLGNQAPKEAESSSLIKWEDSAGIEISLIDVAWGLVNSPEMISKGRNWNHPQENPQIFPDRPYALGLHFRAKIKGLMGGASEMISSSGLVQIKEDGKIEVPLVLTPRGFVQFTIAGPFDISFKKNNISDYWDFFPISSIRKDFLFKINRSSSLLSFKIVLKGNDFAIINTSLSANTACTNFKRNFTGTIGSKIKANWQLTLEDHDLSGLEQYAKIGRDLWLKGISDSEGNFTIEERYPEDTVMGIFNGKFSQFCQTMTGYFSKPDGSQLQPFEFYQDGVIKPSTANINVGAVPCAVAVNPITNKIYVANSGSNGVTVINGSDNSTDTIAVGTNPHAVAVNSKADKIYVVNSDSNSVTVINGSDNSNRSIFVGSNPTAIDINPITNKIYVANFATYNKRNNTVTVINGSDSNTKTITAGIGSPAIVVNPVTNKIYVANSESNNVTVIDGTTNLITTVAAGIKPAAIAVNPTTNKIYVANSESNNVTIIDGFTNSTTTVAVGTKPIAIAVNPVTNKIYLANIKSHNVTVINGSDNTIETITVGILPCAISVNPIINKVYVVNYGSDGVTVINGSDNTVGNITVGKLPCALAINQLNNKAYIVNHDSNDVTVIAIDSNESIPIVSSENNDSIETKQSDEKNKLSSATTNEKAKSIDQLEQVKDIPPNILTTCADFTKKFNGTIGSDINITCKLTLKDSNLFGQEQYTRIGKNLWLKGSIDPKGNFTVEERYPEDTMTGIFKGKLSQTCKLLTGTFSKPDGSRMQPFELHEIEVPYEPAIMTLKVGLSPCTAVINPVNNKIYVVNNESNNVTVINESDNSTKNINVGSAPRAIAVNTITNKIYVVNSESNNVTVIDGGTDATKTIKVGAKPWAIAINAVTNKIYVANYSGRNVTVINGIDCSTTNIAAGYVPYALAVNPVKNKIYVANNGSRNVTIINGVNNDSINLPVGRFPSAVAINQVTNKIYVANSDTDNVTVIDGYNNNTTTIMTGTNPTNIAVNFLTNKIYVLDSNSGDVTVIDGATNKAANIPVGLYPTSLSINPTNDRIYVANYSSSSVTMINGSDNNTSNIITGKRHFFIVVNPINNKIYVVNRDSNDVTVMTE